MSDDGKSGLMAVCYDSNKVQDPGRTQQGCRKIFILGCWSTPIIGQEVDQSEEKSRLLKAFDGTLNALHPMSTLNLFSKATPVGHRPYHG